MRPVPIVNISNDPISGLKRKARYRFHWVPDSQQCIIECWINFYITENIPNPDNPEETIQVDVPVVSERYPEYKVNLVAADEEYDQLYDMYFTNPIILPTIIEGYITLRDSEGKFNI